MRTTICLLAGAFMIVSLAVPPAMAAEAARVVPLLMETSELEKALSASDIRVVDARPPEEYRQGHVPGAVKLPAPATDSLDANSRGYPLAPERAEELFRMAGINRSSHVVVYDHQGHRFAARIFYVLEFFGHPRVSVLNGGFPKWQSEARPTTSEEAQVAPGDFQPDARSEVIATADWVRQHLNDPGVRLVDARSPEEYAGGKMQGPRSGHLPRAVNIEWTRVLAGGDVATMVEVPALKQLFAGAQVEPQQEVVTYCQSGMRASEIYFVLRLLGYPRVRLYDGSWAEWSANPDLPIEK